MKKQVVKITYENGDSRLTSLNGTVAWPTVKEYFLDQWFNIGNGQDEMVKCVAIELV